MNGLILRLEQVLGSTCSFSLLLGLVCLECLHGLDDLLSLEAAFQLGIEFLDGLQHLFGILLLLLDGLRLITVQVNFLNVIDVIVGSCWNSDGRFFKFSCCCCGLLILCGLLGCVDFLYHI